ncbi:MAG TPA: N-acetyltransferase [Acidimicrobiales bacterium]|nr:N-acetyltransferase [Acidimicrobiales bacterium]
MAVTLRPLEPSEVPAYLAALTPRYVEARVESGETRAVAEAVASRQLAELTRAGTPIPGHVFAELVVDGEVAGALWLAPRDETGEVWWVYDVEVDEHRRGQGLGRAAMLLAEDVVRGRGGRELGLNVFAKNTLARRLYDSLGYAAVSTTMHKRL